MQSDQNVLATVVQDRRFYIECVVVRLMKMHKQMQHNTLMQEVVRYCRPRFTPDVQQIKATIENLIEKQYLQRTENTDEYLYLA